MDVFQALSDPVRRQIVADLSDGGERSLTELSQGHRISRQAVTKHLNGLSAAGIIQHRKQGKNRMHRLNPLPLKEVADWLAPYAALWDQRLAALQNFLESEHES